MNVLDDLLEPDEFDLLTEHEQQLYLDAIAAELEAPSLHPIQQRAMDLADEVDELLYGGAAGPGKSFFLRWRAQVLCRSVPGTKVLILRESFPELQRTHMRDAIAEYAVLPDGERPTWRPSKKEWHFPNGSIIEFGYCKTDDDVKQYLSAEYDAIFIDEASEFSKYRIEMLRSRLRTTRRKKAAGIHLHMILATNPGGIGHKYVKERYVVPTGYGEHTFDHVDEWQGREVNRTVGFVRASVFDNPHIDPAYIENLISLPENLRRQYLEGDWDVFEGMYWPDLVRHKDLGEGHTVEWHVISPFEIPHEWPRIRCIDFGFAAPFACLWLAFDQDHTCYVYRELYQSGMNASDQARAVVKASVCRTGGVTAPERIDYTMLDPSCWHNRGNGPNIAGQYRQEGLYCRKANNARIDGWQRVREWLTTVEVRLPDGTVVEQPALRIFSTCTNLLSEFANQVHDKDNPEDLDTRAADHALDALRYGLMSWPRRAVAAKRALRSGVDGINERRLARLDRRKATLIHPELGKLR